MPLEARPVDRDNLATLMNLEVRDDQKTLVAGNAETIAEAAYEPEAWLRGLWDREVAVGLMAMVDMRAEGADEENDFPPDTAYLWRLMIADVHQGRGYGRQAIELAFAQARLWHCRHLGLSVSEDEGNAAGFYRRFGLEPTDRVVDGERLFIGPVPRF